jgi:hypothetical protein
VRSSGPATPPPATRSQGWSGAMAAEREAGAHVGERGSLRARRGLRWSKSSWRARATRADAQTRLSVEWSAPVASAVKVSNRRHDSSPSRRREAGSRTSRRTWRQTRGRREARLLRPATNASARGTRACLILASPLCARRAPGTEDASKANSSHTAVPCSERICHAILTACRSSTWVFGRSSRMPISRC